MKVDRRPNEKLGTVFKLFHPPAHKASDVSRSNQQYIVISDLVKGPDGISLAGERCGICVNDVILEAGGTEMNSFSAFEKIVTSFSSFEVKIIRGNEATVDPKILHALRSEMVRSVINVSIKEARCARLWVSKMSTDDAVRILQKKIRQYLRSKKSEYTNKMIFRELEALNRQRLENRKSLRAKRHSSSSAGVTKKSKRLSFSERMQALHENGKDVPKEHKQVHRRSRKTSLRKLVRTSTEKSVRDLLHDIAGDDGLDLDHLISDIEV